MLNHELEKFKDLYSQYISQIVIVHNASLLFMAGTMKEPGYAVRKALREMNELQKSLQKTSLLAYQESIRIRKELTKQEKLEILRNKKLNPPKIGRPKKEKIK